MKTVTLVKETRRGGKKRKEEKEISCMNDNDKIFNTFVISTNCIPAFASATPPHLPHTHIRARPNVSLTVI